MAPEHPTSTQHEQALLCQFLTPPADPSTSLDYGAPAPMCPAHLGELGGSHHHPATADGVVGADGLGDTSCNLVLPDSPLRGTWLLQDAEGAAWQCDLNKN